MRIGRGTGRRSLQTPANSGIAARAEARLTAVAKSATAKVETALAVDGVPFIIWNKGGGRYKCACKEGSGKVFAASSAVDITPVGASGKPISVQTGGRGKKSGFTSVDDLIFNPSGADTSIPSTPRQKITKQDTNDIRQRGLDYSDAAFSGFVGDNDDPLMEATDAFTDADTMLSDKLINCPICFGSGYTDAWNPNDGVRLALDLSGRFETDMAGIDVLEAAVPTFSLVNRNYIEWSVPLPAAWMILARATLFNDDKVLQRGTYKMTITLPDDTEVPFSYAVLQSLKNNPLATEGPTKFKLQSIDGNELRATHFDLVYLMAKPTRGQMPEVEVPNEDEFADWNLNTNIELSARAVIREGSYVVDGKYKRTWKVDAYSKKQLANGTAYGYTATIRALHSFEKMFSLMNLYVKS